MSSSPAAFLSVCQRAHRHPPAHSRCAVWSRVDGGGASAARVDLPVEVWGCAGGVAGLADVTDDCAGGDVAGADVGVGGQVGAVVVGAVVGREAVRQLADAVVVVLDQAGGRRDDRCAVAAKMSTPWWVRQPQRGAPKVFVKVSGPATGQWVAAT